MALRVCSLLQLAEAEYLPTGVRRWAGPVQHLQQAAELVEQRG